MCACDIFMFTNLTTTALQHYICRYRIYVYKSKLHYWTRYTMQKLLFRHCLSKQTYIIKFSISNQTFFRCENAKNLYKKTFKFTFQILIEFWSLVDLYISNPIIYWNICKEGEINTLKIEFIKKYFLVFLAEKKTFNKR